MVIKQDVWLSEIFEYPVFAIFINQALDVDQINAYVKCQKKAFYFCKIPTAEVATVRNLMSLGFYVVDTALSFQKSEYNTVAVENSQISIIDSSMVEAEKILEIAESCFKYSRFHLDPEIPDVVANKIKKEWTNNCVKKKRGDRLFVATVDKQVCGFLAALYTGTPENSTAVIDLIGVDKAMQRMGVGSSLVQAFEKIYGQTSTRLIVGTQAANIVSSNLYQKLGYRLYNSNYILHFHKS